MTTEVLRIELQDSGGEKTRSSLEKTSESVQGLRGRIAGLSTATKGFGAALVAVGANAIAGFVKGNLDAVDSLGKFADKVGATTEFVSEMQHAAALSGVEINTFRKAIEKSQITIADAAEGTGAAVDALARLGLNAQSLVNLSVDDQFAMIAEAVDKTGISLRDATDIFGRSGTEMVKVLRSGSDAINAMREDARALGKTLSTEDVQAAAKANDAIERLTATFKGLFNQVVVLLADPLAKFLDWLTKAIKKIREFLGWIDKWWQRLKDIGAAGLKLIGIDLEMMRAAEAATAAVGKQVEVTDRLNESRNEYNDAAQETLISLPALTNKTYALVDANLEAANSEIMKWEAQQDYIASLADASSHVDVWTEAQKRSTEQTQRQTEAMGGLMSVIGGVAQLTGAVSPQGLGAISGIIGGTGSMLGLSTQTTQQYGTAAGVGAWVGSATGDGGDYSAIGGAIGGAAGLALSSYMATLMPALAATGPYGWALGAIMATAGAAGGGMLGGLFGGEEQVPKVALGTAPTGYYGVERGNIGQRTVVSTGAFGSVYVGGRDGQERTPEMQKLADRIVELDNMTADILSEQQIRTATKAVRLFNAEVETGMLDASLVMQLRFDEIFHAIGGETGALYDAFKPRADTLPQIITAINALTQLGETSQWVARQFLAADDAFLEGIASLQLINDLVSQDDPIGKIRAGLAELNRTADESYFAQAQSVRELAMTFEGSLQSTNRLAQGMANLDSALANSIAGLDQARAAMESQNQAAITRIRQSGMTAEQIYSENIARAAEISAMVSSGSIVDTAEINRLLSERTQLLTGGFFGLSAERQAEERERVLSTLEAGQQLADAAFDRQEERIIATHEAAMDIVVARMDEVAAELMAAAGAQRQSAEAIVEAAGTSELAA